MSSLSTLIRSTRFGRDVAQQPAALRRLAETLSTPQLTYSGGTVVLTGMGSSLHALYPTFIDLRREGIPAVHVDASELVNHQLDGIAGAELVIAASQSGQSAEVVRLVEHLEEHHAVERLLLITNEPSSESALRAGQVVALGVGPEHSVSSKTFVATLAAADLVGRGIRSLPRVAWEQSIADAAHALETRIENVDAEERSVLAEAGTLVIVARGSSLSTARAGGLITMESSRRPAVTMTGGEFRHGPIEIVEAGLDVVIVGGSSASRAMTTRLAAEVESYGANLRFVGHRPEPSATDFGIAASATRFERMSLEFLYFELLSMSRASSAGIDAGDFRHGHKITATQ